MDKNLTEEKKPSKPILEQKSFYNDLTNIGKSFFLAFRESYLGLVDFGLIGDENAESTINYIDDLSKTFVERLDPKILNFEEIVNKLEAKIELLAASQKSNQESDGEV